MPGRKADRMRPSGEILESLVVDTAPHSLEITRNAKGYYSIVSKMYYGDDEADGIVERQKKIFDKFDEVFKPELEPTKVKEK